MKLYARENLIKKGICEQKEAQEIDIEKMANDMYDMIKKSKNGLDQRELMLDLINNQGWTESDYHLALGLLQRRHKIVYIAD
jgi:uncharacterized protein YfkK (UPF0435 family)